MIEFETDWSLIVAIFAAAGAIFGVIVPWWHRRNESLLQQAVLSLERAYAALTDDGKHRESPHADRTNWLTAARHIQRYKAIKQRIRRPGVHRLVCEDHEEYWRHQFHLSLRSVETKLDYYGEPGSPTAVHPVSAVVVHHFCEWSETTQDPLHNVDIDSLLRGKPRILDRALVLPAYLERAMRDPE